MFQCRSKVLAHLIPIVDALAPERPDLAASALLCAKLSQDFYYFQIFYFGLGDSFGSTITLLAVFSAFDITAYDFCALQY